MMATKINIFQLVLLAFVVCADSAKPLGPDTLELWVGTSATFSCQQRGQSGSEEVNDPVFALRTPNGQTTLITEDSKQYFLAKGKINLRNSETAIFPERHYYLGISEVSEVDDGLKVICISEEDSKDSDILDDEFQHLAVTLNVRPIEECSPSSTEKTSVMAETTSMTSGPLSTPYVVTSRRDPLTTTGKTDKVLQISEKSGARKQNEDNGDASSAEHSKANSTENGLDTMTSAVIFLAVCLILAIASCVVLFSKNKHYRTKYLSCGSTTNTTLNNNFAMEIQTSDTSNGHLLEPV